MSLKALSGWYVLLPLGNTLNIIRGSLKLVPLQLTGDILKNNGAGMSSYLDAASLRKKLQGWVCQPTTSLHVFENISMY